MTGKARMPEPRRVLGRILSRVMHTEPLRKPHTAGKIKEKGSIAYTPFARELIREHKGIVKQFLLARQEILKGKKRVEMGHITAEKYVPPHDYKGSVNAGLYRVRIGKKSFFIKEQNGDIGDFNPRTDLATPQFNALVKARQLTSSMKGVEIANYHLAWTRGNQSFLATDFYEGESVSKRNKDLEHYYYFTQSAGKRVDAKIKEIKRVLDPYFDDVLEYNMLYLPSTDTIVVFDLRPKG